MRIIRDDIPGFTPPGDVLSRWQRRSALIVELLTSFALIGAIGIAAFAVSMEIAEAGARTVHTSAHGAALSALLILLLGTGGLTAFFVAVPAIRNKSNRARQHQ